MEIQERAKKYAEGKALEAITEAIEKAYAKGFADGYQEGQNMKEPFIEDGIEYVDLGLPSGTKWSKTYIKNDKSEIKQYTYEEAAMVNIPTYEQFQELVNNCSFNSNQVGIYDFSIDILGRNGNKIYLKIKDETQFFNHKTDILSFWIKSMSNPLHGNNRSCFDYRYKSKFGLCFMGKRLPILLVK